MHLSHLPPTALLLLATALTLITPATAHRCDHACPSALRLFIAKLIPAAYDQPSVAASTAAFTLVPFADDAKVELIIPSSPTPIVVATNGTAARAFADQTRASFEHVSGTYEDFPKNGSVVIDADVKLKPSNGKLPPSFQADVILDFDLHTCEIAVLRAVGNIPAALLG